MKKMIFGRLDHQVAGVSDEADVERGTVRDTGGDKLLDSCWSKALTRR